MNDQQMTNRPRQQGLTLIELLIAMAIALVLIFGVVTLYSQSLQQARLNANLAQMDENSRFALDKLAKDVRMAGFSGCLAYDQEEEAGAFWSVYNKNGEASYSQAVVQGMQGFDINNTDWGEGVLLINASDSGVAVGSGANVYGPNYTATEQANFDNAAANSDSLRLWSAVQGVDVIQGFPASDADFAAGEDLLVSDNPAAAAVLQNCGGANAFFNAGDMVMYSSCGIRLVAQVCEVNGNQLSFRNGAGGSCNNVFPAGRNYSGNAGDGGELFKLQDITYYVGFSDFVSGQPSLFRGVGQQRFELAPGVENMQLLFGYDLDAELGSNEKSADAYASATQLRDLGINWNDVVSVRISLVIRSPEELIGEAERGATELVVNGQEIEVNDGYLRRVYTRTISLRNRVTGF